MKYKINTLSFVLVIGLLIGSPCFAAYKRCVNSGAGNSCTAGNDKEVNLGTQPKKKATNNDCTNVTVSKKWKCTDYYQDL